VFLKRFNLVWFFFLLLACQKSDTNFYNLNGKPVNIDTGTKVLIFLNTECPICQKYQGSLHQFNQDSVILVFPGQSDTNAVKSFAAYDSIPLTRIIIDTDFRLTKMLGAKTTPQTIITLNGKVKYKGLIDDRFMALGSARQFAHVNYIRNALISLQQNHADSIAHTEPVGCLIEPH